MKQKWYKKASTQAAIVTGVFLIVATVISSLSIPHSSPSTSSTTSPSTSSTTSPSSPSPGLELADILVQPEQGGVCVVDFRVVNKSSSEVIISRVRFRVIQVETFRPPAMGYVEFSKIYDLDISDLEKPGDVVECMVSQVIEPNCTDRFGIRLTAQNMPAYEGRIWMLEVILTTSEGIIVSGPIRIELP